MTKKNPEFGHDAVGQRIEVGSWVFTKRAIVAKVEKLYPKMIKLAGSHYYDTVKQSECILVPEEYALLHLRKKGIK